jgi:putative hydrolase of the HAD superfamily
MCAVKAVFFDIDDTLYDSTTLTTMARRNSISAMVDAGLPEKNEEKVFDELQKIIAKFGSNYPRHYDELLKALKVEWNPKIIASGVVAYERTKAGYLRPFPEVVPTLLALKKRYLLGVISNGLAVKQWEKLTWLGLHHLFDSVTTSEDIKMEKPEPGIFTHAMDSLGVGPSTSVMVGDRLDTDIRGAKEAGMISVRIAKGKYGLEKPKDPGETPDFEITEIWELPEILAGI